MPIGLVVLAILQAGPVQKPPVADSAITLKPGAQYEAGWLRRRVFGDGWRDLWTTAIQVPVANLDTLGGGLEAFDRGGAGQSMVLRFRGPEGSAYNFRSVDKTPGRNVSGFRRAALFIYREHIGGMFPAAGVPVGELEAAAGILAPPRWLAVLPDSPRLGKWREEFKGVLGTFERRYAPSEPLPEVPGLLELVSSESLLVHLKRDPLDQVDQPAYLTNRLFDLIISDNDRHADQFNWARFDRNGLRSWVPLPKDRDWAFSHSDGLLYATARLAYPLWGKFGPRYDNLKGLLLKSRTLDRLILTGLDRAAWDSVTTELQSRLTDALITDAAGQLPSEFDRATLDHLTASLRGRRDALPEAARRYYSRLARVVDLHGSDGPELVEVTRGGDGSVALEVFAANRVPLLRRRFLPDETSELRLHLGSGADTLRVRGQPGGIPIRVITGGGADLVTDSTGGRALRVYDDSASATVRATGSVPHSVRPFHAASDDPLRQPQDWGRKYGFVGWFRVRPELGFVLGGGPVVYHYGFRKVPYQSKLAFRVATTTGIGRVNADFKGDFRFERPDRRILVRAAALQADVIRYFGFGNETVRQPLVGFHNVIQRNFNVQPVLELGVGRPGRAQLGVVLQHTETDSIRATLLRDEKPYGSGSFTEAGFLAGLSYDSRDNEEMPTRGVTLNLGGRLFPRLFDVDSTFASLNLVGTVYLSAAGLPMRPTLALRAGAMRLFGGYPFFEAAHVGGRATLRGLTTRRYTGDAAVYVNSEVRLNLGSALTGGDWGIFSLTDAGRVFLNDENSRRWRTAFGGGLWLALDQRSKVLTASLAASGEGLRFYLHSGFHFSVP